MKKYIVFILVVLIAKDLTAQLFSVSDKQTIVTQTPAFHPVFDKKGTELLFTTINYEGLFLYNNASNSVDQISKSKGAGYEPAFSGEQEIIYQEHVREQNRVFKSLKSYNRKSRQVAELIPATRDFPQKLRSMKRTETQIRSSEKAVTVVGENLKIVVYEGQTRKELTPLGDIAGYIWISLSPDGKRILFHAASKGTYTCDLNGENLICLGQFNAPVWYDNAIVVGMKDKDNGDNITASAIIAVDIQGKKSQVLSDTEEIALYPAASSVLGKIAYSTSNGELRVLNVTPLSNK